MMYLKPGESPYVRLEDLGEVVYPMSSDRPGFAIYFRKIRPSDVKMSGDQGDRCVQMLFLCGELGGMRPGETPVQYLRRLIDRIIDLEAARQL